MSHHANEVSVPTSISVLLLARDETADLEALIPQLGFANEVVVVVDAESPNDTVRAAERLGARVFLRKLEGFGAQRAFALSQCRGEWVLWIDADERLAAGGAAALHAATTGAASGYRVRRRTWFLGKRIRYCGWQEERVLRLFRRAAARFDDALLHESVHVEGTIADLDVTLEHHSYRDWAACRDKLFRYAAAGAARARAAGRGASLLEVAFKPPLRFLRMYVLQLGFLDGAHGFLLCALAATQVLLRCADLWAGARAGKP
jgi:glycosyltransferase involved in cell wall biosynthesis